MAFIHLYKGNPTAGGTDGILVSEGSGASPVSVGPLNATANEESNPIKLALRCEQGYHTTDVTTVMPVGTTAAKWALAPDAGDKPGAWQPYGQALTITDTISTTNYIIWAKARATADEQPANDVSVDLQVNASIIASS